MREYIYIWNEPKENFFVVSGIEFKDFKNILTPNSGLLFLEHSSYYLQFNQETGFDFTIAHSDNLIWTENIYSWGNCIWVDFIDDVLENLSDTEISELLFFKHKARPLNKITIPKLQNRYLAFAHDDGFFLKLYYSTREDAVQLKNLIQKEFEVNIDDSEFENSDFAFWIEKSKVERLEKTFDIDSILKNNRIKKIKRIRCYQKDVEIQN